MVSRSLYGSVVASTKWTWSGGSSRVFSRALLAAFVSMCASSRMNILLAPPTDATVETLTRMSRMSSTLLCEAASNSMTSMDDEVVTALHESQLSQGSSVSERLGQLRAFARSRAVVVLPVPRGPAKR